MVITPDMLAPHIGTYHSEHSVLVQLHMFWEFRGLREVFTFSDFVEFCWNHCVLVRNLAGTEFTIRYPYELIPARREAND